jgi:hypothetical protein
MRRRKKARAFEQKDSSKTWRACSVLPGELKVDTSPYEGIICETRGPDVDGLKHMLDALFLPLYYEVEAYPKQYRPPHENLPQNWLHEPLQCLVMDLALGKAFSRGSFVIHLRLALRHQIVIYVRGRLHG